VNSELLAQAKAWLAQDPDPETRAELAALIAAENEPELQSRFGARLAFGTAGLRGELGAGPNRMNRVLVGQAALGLAMYLIEHATDEQPSVVIGFDGRKNSDIFARDSAEIISAWGIRVLLFETLVPTPLLAFALRHLGLSAGVMVTASHNPPNDNGYKVYLGGANGGSQIVSPADNQIAAHIEQVARNIKYGDIPREPASEYGDPPPKPFIEFVTDEVRAAYAKATMDAAANLAGGKVPATNAAALRITYTAMHGVGWNTVRPLFSAAGFKLDVVAEQINPDATFATVAFPNPEEPGAMDLAFARARATNAHLIMANDPDADRLAIGIPDSSSPEGYRRLTGDEVGLILGHAAAVAANRAGRKGAIACSIVSSSALAAVAKKFDLDFKQTLTGFKWIAKVPNLIFGYEEALGYAIDPGNTPDKDGISAALAIAMLAAELNAQGITLEEHLDSLRAEFGYFANGQVSLRFSDLSEIARLMTGLRENPPTKIDGVAAKLTDLNEGSADLPPTDGLRFDLADSRRVIVRPSGTEPKLKCYLQAVGSSKTQAEELLSSLDASMREILAAI
jgi:phosphomannomutase